MPERSRVPRASTYRVRPQEPICPWCGEAIREWQGFHLEQDDAFGNIPLPVHDDCSGERQRGDPR